MDREQAECRPGGSGLSRRVRARQIVSEANPGSLPYQTRLRTELCSSKDSVMRRNHTPSARGSRATSASGNNSRAMTPPSLGIRPCPRWPLAAPGKQDRGSARPPPAGPQRLVPLEFASRNRAGFPITSARARARDIRGLLHAGPSSCSPSHNNAGSLSRP